MTRFLNLLANLFPLWVALACAAALIDPNWILWLKGPFIIWGLAVIMLGMGITLDLDDFRRVARMPKAVVTGVVAQFLLMPFWGWAVGRMLHLPTDMAVGLILVACCPGGTASNVVTYIAKANVALSVLMTMCSTAVAIVLTPLLTSWIAGQYVPVDAFALFLSMVKIVLAPVALGMLFHRVFPNLVKSVIPVGPFVAVVVIALICAAILGQRREAVLESGLQALAAVTLLHTLAFASGYAFAKFLKFDAIICRTVSIEVGMQNSGLATALAAKHFAATPLTAVPCAISAVMHSVIGSALAGYWRLKTPNTKSSRV